MPETSQLLEDLLQVRKDVEENWIKGRYFDLGGGACAVGAIARTVGLQHAFENDMNCNFAPAPWLGATFQGHVRGRAVTDAVAKHLPSGWLRMLSKYTGGESVIPAWNDDPMTTKDDVLEVVCKAIRNEAERLGLSVEENTDG
jgi:hypothetical protein